MKRLIERIGSLWAWWCALLAMAVLGPWPVLVLPWWAAVLVCCGLAVLAWLRDRTVWPWCGVVVAVVLAGVDSPQLPSEATLEHQLERFCDEMISSAEELAADPTLLRLLAATGETLDPGLPFEVLQRHARGRSDLTIYLADERNRLIAWAGAQRAFPPGIRALGERRWEIVWSSTTAALVLREPLIDQGRFIGAVTLCARTELRTRAAWGMRAGVRNLLVLGQWASPTLTIAAKSRPGVVVPLRVVELPRSDLDGLSWLGWVLLCVACLVLAPELAWLAVAVAGVSYVVTTQQVSQLGGAMVVIGAAAAGNRLARCMREVPAKLLIGAGVAAASVITIAGGAATASWLPVHLLRPGWGAVWVVAVAVLVGAWPLPQPGRFTLSRRLILAGLVASLALILALIGLPLELVRTLRAPHEHQPLTGDSVILQQVLAASSSSCDLTDLAPLLARRWDLEGSAKPYAVFVFDEYGGEMSRWGDLELAGSSSELVAEWSIQEVPGASVELWAATPPWSLLRDWRPGEMLDMAWEGAVWFAVLNRSGMIAATLHPQIRNLDPTKAGNIYHAQVGWTRILVGDSPQLALVKRVDEWLVVAVIKPSQLATWAIKVALASVWAILGLSLARPPVLRREQLATFGGRLRLLVTGGVVLPLIILTLFLQQRLLREKLHNERVLGFDALRSARFTVEHLAEGAEVDDELARWLSRQVGGEVILFDDAQVVAASRPDFLRVGILPELPAAEVFPHFQLGRNDPVVLRQQGRLTAVGATSLQGKRLLLQVFPVDPLQQGETPDAVDWLLTGAILAALLAFVLTSRVEQRLSASLRELVALARRLHRGEPMGQVRQPSESDLREVIDAVRLMNEEVRQREESLRHQEELLRITLATLLPAVVVLDADGEIRFTNPSAEQLIAEHGERVLAKVRELETRCEENEPCLVEAFQPLPGAELTWRLGVARVPLPDGSRGIVAVVDDVTDLVRVDRLRQLNQMARIIAHEVKNPLTPIRLWVQELEQVHGVSGGEKDELVVKACQEISQQVSRLQELASSFSNLAALDRWEHERLDVTDVVTATLSGLSVLERRGVTVSTSVPDQGLAMVRADRQWLRRALGNLLHNSITALGNELGQIWVRVTIVKRSVVLEVEDSAGGVAEAQLAELFSPSFSTTTAGSGLGLALVEQVVRRCHGQVTAHNTDHGLLVRITLPLSSGTMRT